MTKSAAQAKDIYTMLRARNPIIWVRTQEEKRVERYLIEAILTAKYEVRTWDVAAGICNGVDGAAINAAIVDPDEALRQVEQQMPRVGKVAWIFRDLAPWLQGGPGLTPTRRLRNLARVLPETEPDKAQAIFIISPSREMPPELVNHVTLVEWPLPDREEIEELLDAAIATLPERSQVAALDGQEARDAAIDAAIGLSGEEAETCFARSLAQSRKIDPVTIAAEKERVIARSGLLRWIKPLEGGMDAVGGLGLLKAWIIQRKLAHSPKARAYRLQAPKGALLAGIPGCGKTLIAKATGADWGCPVLQLDLGALKSKFVGDSEARIRAGLAVIDAIGLCVVLIDEIEKAVGGAVDGAADGGVSSDALGTLLTWMQERKGEAFIIATANNAEKLPAELMRRGRLDRIWFIDLPTLEEKIEVLRAALAERGRQELKVDLGKVAMQCNNFTGAEVASLVPEAMFAAYAENRELNTQDLLRVAEDTVPLAMTAAKRIEALRAWGTANAKPASESGATVAAPARTRGRVVQAV